MTDQEIEKLREKLGSEYSVKRLNGAISVELVDIWKGVEFAECDSDAFDSYTVGKIYPILNIDGEWIMTKYDDKLSPSNGLRKDEMNPSTESAYVEQLKAKVHKLYGEIKHGDRFEFTWIGDGIEQSIHLKGKYDFYYDKESDTLDLHGFPLYQRGQWAKKVDRVRVDGNWNSYDDNCIKVNFKFNYKGNYPSPASIASHLAKCLEEYLNKIP